MKKILFLILHVVLFHYSKGQGQNALKNDSLVWFEGKCYDTHGPLNLKSVLLLSHDLAQKKHLSELKELAARIGRDHRRQSTLAITGGALFVTAAALTGITALAALDYKKNVFKRNIDTFGRCIIGAFGLGLNLEMASLMKGSVKKYRLKKAIELYNRNL